MKWITTRILHIKPQVISLLGEPSSTNLAGRPAVYEKQDIEEGISWTDQEFTFRNDECLLIQDTSRFNR